jgi:hypothetical protein
VPYRIVMDVITMNRKVPVVSNHVFPKSSLPHRGLSMLFPRGSPLRSVASVGTIMLCPPYLAMLAVLGISYGTSVDL